MYLVAIAWLYVTVMMAVAEAAAPNGSWLGAFFTFALYGVLPLSIVLYILGTPGRKRRLRAAREPHGSAPESTSAAVAPDAGGQAPAAAEPCGVAPVREKL
jgi:membrane protein implicated in regulation of membrane protease activity